MATDDGNSRVTVAILKNEMGHLGEKIDRYCDEIRGDLKDHETRLRTLEGRESWSVWRDLGAYVAAIGAGIATALKQ